MLDVPLRRFPLDDGRTLTYGPHTEAPLEEELAAASPLPQQRRSLDSCLPNGGRAPQQAQRAASTRLREQAQQAETVRTLCVRAPVSWFLCAWSWVTPRCGSASF